MKQAPTAAGTGEQPNARPTAHSARHPEPARLGIRLRAFLLDYLLFLGYAACLVAVAALLRTAVEPLFTASAASAQLTGFIMLTLPVILYFASTESSPQQASWGKRRLGLRVVDGRGERIGFGRSLVRSAVKFLPWELGHYTVWQWSDGELPPPALAALVLAYALVAAYIVLPLVVQSRRSVYDLVAGTRVERIR